MALFRRFAPMAGAEGNPVDEPAISCHLQRVAMKTCIQRTLWAFYAAGKGRMDARPCHVTVQEE
jgi:hypothetical protein